MSGGSMDYSHFHIMRTIETIENVIHRNGRLKTREELKEEYWRDSEWYKKYPEDLFYNKYSDEVIKEFKKGIKILRQAYTYTKRIDWLLSGDDDEDGFIKRLRKELEDYEV